MEGPEVLAVAAAAVGGWMAGRRNPRTGPGSPADRDQQTAQAVGARVERTGREMADRFGAAVGTGGLKASVFVARGVRSAGNVMAAGAGRSAAALDSARSTVAGTVDRVRHGSDGGTAGTPDDAHLIVDEVRVTQIDELIVVTDPISEAGVPPPPADTDPLA